MNHPASQSSRPPLWLAAAAVAAGWGAVYDIGRWIAAYVTFPAHEDVRIYYVAAQAGLRYGWSTIYDMPTLRALSAGFAGGQTNIDSSATYISPPLLAWLFAPLTAVSEPVAYALWAVLSLAALLLMWRIAAPYPGVAKFALLLLALALWPVLDAFYRGQPVLVLLALVAASWWLTVHDRPWAAGFALAFATALIPQVVYLVPLALLVSGRYRVVLGWAAACLVLALAFIVSLGQSGLQTWWQTFQLVESNGEHAYFTLAYLFGFGIVTYSLLAILGVAALAVAWKRRADVDMVFAAGLLGSLAVSVHLHLYDYSTLVLAALLFLRTAPPLWQRLWLLVGVVTMQALALGLPAPQLIWDAAWLAVLAVSSFFGSGASGPATRRATGSGARAGT
ncbi:MAG TPA: glycosyltransferase family 87 protein [Candidatus Acidoferrum sp.]|nr:glycosyltransferase family 87 protein [Candidatus Acidoferrum sp.]